MTDITMVFTECKILLLTLALALILKQLLVNTILIATLRWFR